MRRALCRPNKRLIVALCPRAGGQREPGRKRVGSIRALTPVFAGYVRAYERPISNGGHGIARFCPPYAAVSKFFSNTAVDSERSQQKILTPSHCDGANTNPDATNTSDDRILRFRPRVLILNTLHPSGLC